MAIESKIPEISVLRDQVEKSFGSSLLVHSNFEVLADDIFRRTKQHISVTTLERLWNYSTRGYDTVSRHTLDVLCAYLGVSDWENFKKSLKEQGERESDLFDEERVLTSDLQPDDRLRIGWQPDRLCVVRYLGDNRFIAEETHNSKLSEGDTFSCLQFQLHSPLYLTDLKDSAGVLKGGSYGVGLRNGLTILQFL